MSEGCTHDCSSCGQSCSERKEQFDFSAKLNAASKVKKVIAVASGKGGVGKSFVTSTLAAAAAKRGLRTAILDADITGPSIPKAFGISGGTLASEQGILPGISAGGVRVISLNMLVEKPEDPVVWRGPVIAGTVRQFWTEVFWDDIDIMFVDMPPGTGDVPLTVFQSLPIDGVVVVCSPQELVGMIVEKSVRMAEMMDKKVVGLVENMSYFECPDCGKRHEIFGHSHIKEIAKSYGLDVLARIPIEPQLAAKCDAGQIETVADTHMQDAVQKLLDREEKASK